MASLLGYNILTSCLLGKSFGNTEDFCGILKSLSVTSLLGTFTVRYFTVRYCYG